MVISSYRYTEFRVLFTSAAFADRINPTTNSNLVTCNYSIIVVFHTRATVRTGHLPTIELARTYVATATATASSLSNVSMGVASSTTSHYFDRSGCLSPRLHRCSVKAFGGGLRLRPSSTVVALAAGHRYLQR